MKNSPILRLVLVAIFAIASANCGGLAAQEKSPPEDQSKSTANEVDSETADAFRKDKTDVAVDKAIAYLISKQRDNGSITDAGHDTTMSALSIMAMASVGIQPGDPTPEGKAMNKALEFVLRDDRMESNGYLGKKDGSRMYGHGIIALMLTEMLGMGTSDQQDEKIHQRCQKAIDVILSAQKVKKPPKSQGGWRYTPDARDADLSVTVWQLMALRSAKNDGMQVPSAAIRDAVKYLERTYAAKLDRNGMPDKQASGFCYEPGRNKPTFTMTSAGLLAMQVCGKYESPLVAGAADWLLEHPPKWTDKFSMYGIYYYSQGMYQRGEKHAQTSRKLVQELLLEKQSGDGSWQSHKGSERDAGKVYGTSMAVLSLSVKYHYLPIYQK